MAGVTSVADTLRATAQVLTAMADDAALCAAANRAVDLVVASFQAGGKLMLCGNGGSAADAQHWAAELVGRFHYDRPGLPAIALTTDTSILTAVGNDYGYEASFSRQIEALGRRGDVLFVLSTSGRSPNIVAAIKAARERGIAIDGFTGAGGGEMPFQCEVCIRVPTDSTPRIQEGHEALGHAMCAMIEAAMFPVAR